MKKLLLASAVMLFALGVSHSRMISGLPKGEQNNLATADYGGVLVSTNAFTVNHTTASIVTSGVVYGVVFSSGVSTDFVEIFDSTTTLTAGTPIMRLYNVNASTGGLNTYAAGFSGLDKPVRYSKGLIWRASTAVYNVISVLYNEDEVR